VCALQIDTVTLAGAMLNNPGPHDIPEGVAPTAAPVATTDAAAGVAAGAAAVGVAGAAGAAAAVGTPHVPATAGAGAAAHKRQRRARASSHRRGLRDFNTDFNPPISTLQWSWIGTMLNASTADWLIVVGNDPIWSAGSHGPTWALADTLLPMLNAAGVSLYISGRDPVPQHFASGATYPATDCVVIGNGAGGNATQAASLPNEGACPKGTLNWAGTGDGGGFLTVSIAESPTNAAEGLMTVTFFDESGAIQHSFTKPNPRKGGKSDPPSTGKSAADIGSDSAGLIGMFGLVLVAAAGYGVHTLSEAASAKSEAEAKARLVRATGGGGGGEGGARGGGGLEMGSVAVGGAPRAAAPAPARVRGSVAAGGAGERRPLLSK
jgi:hypothetical protein